MEGADENVSENKLNTSDPERRRFIHIHRTRLRWLVEGDLVRE
jgi:hypothetical protein